MKGQRPRERRVFTIPDEFVDSGLCARLSNSALRAYLYLKRCASSEGYATRSIRQVATMAGLSRSAAQEGIQELVAKRVIEVVSSRPNRKGQKREVGSYRVLDYTWRERPPGWTFEGNTPHDLKQGTSAGADTNVHEDGRSERKGTSAGADTNVRFGPPERPPGRTSWEKNRGKEGKEARTSAGADVRAATPPPKMTGTSPRTPSAFKTGGGGERHPLHSAPDNHHGAHHHTPEKLTTRESRPPPSRGEVEPLSPEEEQRLDQLEPGLGTAARRMLDTVRGGGNDASAPSPAVPPAPPARPGDEPEIERDEPPRAAQEPPRPGGEPPADADRPK